MLHASHMNFLSSQFWYVVAADNLPYEKVGKNEPVCIADEVPFEIPESWEWVRLKNITVKEIKRGKSPKYAESSNVYVFAQKCNVKLGGIDISLAKCLDVKAFEKYPIDEYMVNEDIIINSTGNGTLGRIGMFHDSDRINDFTIVPDSHVTIIRACKYLIKNYLFYTLKYYQPYLEKLGEGSTNQTELRPSTVAELFIPIPPIGEQKRIIEKLLEVIPMVNAYGNKEKELQVYNKDFPAQLKKSILQEAIQGKLVPQDPNDEPASLLLEHIRAEKERLIKEGKIKRDKHESVIYRRDNSHYEKRGSEEVCIDDEIPFEIPESWCWSRLSFLCKSIADGDHQAPPQTVSGIPFIVISNVSTGKIDFTNTRFVSQEYYDNLPESRIPHRNDILFTVTGSYGIVIPVNVDNLFCFQRHIALLKPLEIATNFLVTWLSTPIVYEQCKNYATGTAQKTVGLNSLKNILIPVPPIKEQERILERLKSILYLITL